jgi:glycosyltransferase involved in cell wall biosynthesis
MRITLNGTIFGAQNSGAKQRFVSLYQEIVRQSPDLNYDLVVDETGAIANCFAEFKNTRIIQSPLNAAKPLHRFVRGQSFWKKYLDSEKPQILDHSHLPIIQNPYGKTILTVHDIRYLKYPEHHSLFRRMVAPYILKKSMRLADLVVTVSESMKEELSEFIHPSKVVVIPNGLNRPSMPQLQTSHLEALKTLGVRNPFLLTVGHFEKRKNLVKLLEAFLKLSPAHPDLQLVMAGNPADDLRRIEAFVASHDLNKSVLILKNISFEFICALYSQAQLFIFPSVYEGFGIPILEALHYHCRMALSDIAVFRELTRSKGIYFNPNNSESIRQTIERMLWSEPNCDSDFIQGYSEILNAYNYTNHAAKYLKIMRTDSKQAS